MKLHDTINKIESALDELESEDINLDTAIDKYAKAMTLAKSAMDSLDKSKAKFETITQSHEKLLQD